MEFLCEDRSEHGVVLVSASSPDYETLQARIRYLQANPVAGSPPLPEKFRPRIVPEDRPTSAILLNRSAKSIAGLQAIWRSETESGRSFHRLLVTLSPRPLLVPFGLPNSVDLKRYEYWNTIFPGSRRYIGQSGMVGDNSDVRPPADEEKWRGGMVGGGAGGGSRSPEAIRRVTLVLDGVFFRDGEFVGPDTGRMFDQTVAEAEAHRMVAKIARQGHHDGLSAADILARIERVTGVAPEHYPTPPHFQNRATPKEDFLATALESIAYQLAMRRRFPQPVGDDETVFNIMTWDEVPLPRFRRS